MTNTGTPCGECKNYSTIWDICSAEEVVIKLPFISTYDNFYGKWESSIDYPRAGTINTGERPCPYFEKKIVEVELGFWRTLWSWLKNYELK